MPTSTAAKTSAAPAPRAVPANADDAFNAEAERLRRKYPNWMFTEDIAVEEECSVETARRHLQSGECGPVDRALNGSLRILTTHYIRHLQRRTVVSGRST